MKKRSSNIFIFTAVLFIFSTFGCNQFLSTDISSVNISVNSPSDSLYTSNDQISFWWETNPDIERFAYQLVTPDFQNPFILVDTLLLDHILNYKLQEDVYTWRIRGVNEGSETPYITRLLIIDLSPPLKATNLSSDTLFQGTLDTLRWDSRDANVGQSGLNFSVSDSIILYQRGDSTQIHQLDFSDDAKSYGLDVDSDLQGAGEYYWQVVTIDQAGNRRKSEYFRFTVQ